MRFSSSVANCQATKSSMRRKTMHGRKHSPCRFQEPGTKNQEPRTKNREPGTGNREPDTLTFSMKFAPDYVTYVLNENFEDAKELFLLPLMAIQYAHLVM